MGRVKSLRREAKALGYESLPRFAMPSHDDMAESFSGWMPFDIVESVGNYELMKAMKPTRRAWIAMLSSSPSVKEIRLIRDKFIPLAMQHRHYSARDAEALDLELLGELPEYCKDWPYSLRVAYACIRNVRGPAGELNVWVAQLGNGRTQAEKNRILLNMAKALSMAKSANPDD